MWVAQTTLFYSNEIDIQKDVLLGHIFPTLDANDLVRCSQVNKRWRECADQVLERRLIHAAFGEEKWAKHWCAIAGKVFAIPMGEMLKVGKRLDPHRKLQRILQSHDTPVFNPRFVKLPGSEEAVLFTSTIFKDYILKPLGCVISAELESWFDTHKEPIGDDCWHLMSNDVIPGSRNKNEIVQEDFFKNCERCRSPMLFEALLSMVATRIISDKRIYSDNPIMYTQCWFKLENKIKVLQAGCFSDSKGPQFYNRSFDGEDIGIASLWKFSSPDQDQNMEFRHMKSREIEELRELYRLWTKRPQYFIKIDWVAALVAIVSAWIILRIVR